MKRLVIVRHAKSMHESYVATDIERHLAGRGYDDVAHTVAFLKGKGIAPDLIVSSPAIRAFSTALIVANRFGYPADRIQLNSSVYEASVNNLLYVVQELPDKVNTAFLFGHNPGFTELINMLCGFTLSNLPTAAVAIIDFKTDKWSEIEIESGTCMHLFSAHKDVF